MVSFYKEIIKDLQKKLPLDNTLLKALTCLNPRKQRAHDSLQHCKVLASQMPSLQPQEEVVVGDEWIHYQELNVEERDLKLRVDQFWHKVFIMSDATGEKFSVLPKMIKCALALCHSNADVERSLSINKKVVTKQNVSMKRETLTGLRSVKAAVQGYGGVDKLPITLDTVRVAENSYRMHNEHLKEEQAKKRQKEMEKQKCEAQKRKLEEIKAEEKNLHDRLKQLKEEDRKAKEAMDRAMGYIDEGGKKISEGLKSHNMMEVEAGQKLIEFGREKQMDAKKRLNETSEERDRIEAELFKIKDSKKLKK